MDCRRRLGAWGAGCAVACGRDADVRPFASRLVANQDVWPEITRLNAAIEAMTTAEPTTFLIPTAAQFLDPDSGRPIPALFRADRLHLSQAGYAVWAGVIASALDEVLAETPTRRSP